MSDYKCGYLNNIGNQHVLSVICQRDFRTKDDLNQKDNYFFIIKHLPNGWQSILVGVLIWKTVQELTMRQV